MTTGAWIKFQQIVTNFRKFLTRCGINSEGLIQEPPPPIIQLRDGMEGAIDAGIKNFFGRMYDTNTKPQFVNILPCSDVAICNSIKTVGNTKAGIQTICIVCQKFMKQRP